MAQILENTTKLGQLKAFLSPHVLSKSIGNELDRFPSMTIAGLGQGGGRMAAELARFGLPTFLFNSSISDMNEHTDIIPDERRIVTKSDKYQNLEGTDKNAQLGYQIAVDNKDTYAQVLLKEEFQTAEFVWVTVSLGGGTGNGALKVALSILSQIRAKRALPGGKVPLGVICSLPSSDEKGSAFRKNALAGVKILQDLINENKIGNVLVIDNEKMRDFYENNNFKTSNNRLIDAKSYTNMIVASSLVEAATIPLMGGRSVLDKTELLSTWATPGWLSISKMNNIKINEDFKYDKVIKTLFTNNEVLADYSFGEMNSDDMFNTNVSAGAVAVIYPDIKNIPPQVADDVYKYASNLLNTKVNLAISRNERLNELLIYGLAVLSEPPTRIQALIEEKDQWEKIEKDQAEKKKQASLNLSGFDDFFSLDNDDPSENNPVSKDELDMDFGDGNIKNNTGLVEVGDIDLDF
ncbi:cell division protein FtsZ [Bacillus sp. SM2101]|uniref:cell division protein FtsZ n=1 Tax=Bacillus sp. SM2101 TaxID=2805366 RepID=UPI001BDE11E0|nr:cell division protein FtsZ [Bacillus sp. SM2101]